tara:strand:+ start:37 stop:249 length:213 start_codon:yes stop_codon:yes gene_type:complete
MQRRFGSSAARRAVNFRFFGEVVGELKRVTWPTRQEAMRLTLMVIAVSAVIGAFLGAADIVYGWVFGFIL